MTPEQFCFWLKGYLEISDLAPGTGLEQRTRILDVLRQVLERVVQSRDMINVSCHGEQQTSLPLERDKSRGKWLERDTYGESRG